MSEYEMFPQPEGMINFAVGQPENVDLPARLIEETGFAPIVDPACLQYGNIQGYASFRQAIARVFGELLGLPMDPQTLLVTNGTSGTLPALLSVFRRKTQKVFVEEPTFFMALDFFKEYGFDIEYIPSDLVTGIDLDVLQAKAEAHNGPALLYVIPVFQNPTGTTLSHEKRERLAAIAEAQELIVLADETYQFLYFEEDQLPPPPLYYYSPSTCLSINTFSKILAPALRVGWVQCAPEFVQEFLSKSSLVYSGGFQNSFMQRIVHNILDHKDGQTFFTHIKRERAKLCSQFQAMKTHLTAGTYVEPRGGYFIWLKVPVDTTELKKACAAQQIGFILGETTTARESSELKQFIRLSFAHYPESKVAEGTQKLVALIQTLEKASSNT